MDSAGFPAVVTAHFVPIEGQQRPRTTILIKFAEEVIYNFPFFKLLFCFGSPPFVENSIFFMICGFELLGYSIRILL